jgi:hypothetical protein
LSCFLVWLSLSNCDAFKHVLLCSCLAFAFKLWCSQTCTAMFLSCFLVLFSLSNCDALKHVLLCSCLAFLSCFRFQIVMLSNMYCLLLSCFRFQIVMLSNMYCSALVLLSCFAFLSCLRFQIVMLSNKHTACMRVLYAYSCRCQSDSNTSFHSCMIGSTSE